jgi:hypothetical protein
LADIQTIKITARNPMVRAHNGGHRDHKGELLPPYTVSIDCFQNGQRRMGMMPLCWPEINTVVQDWCDMNCSGKVWIGKKSTIHFHDEGDAILFHLSFK